MRAWFPRQRFFAVDGYAVDNGRLNYSLRTAQHSNAPIALIVQRASAFSVLNLNYHDGPRFPAPAAHSRDRRYALGYCCAPRKVTTVLPPLTTTPTRSAVRERKRRRATPQTRLNHPVLR